MWEQQELRRIAPWPWALVTSVALLPLMVGGLWWWNRSEGVPDFWLRLILYWVALLLSRALGACWYNLSVRWHRGVLLWWSHGQLAGVDVRRLWRVAALMCPQGALSWGLLALFGVIPGGIPLTALVVGGAVVGMLASVGSAWLYGSVVVAVTDMLSTRWSAAASVRLEALDLWRTRSVAGWLVFAWGIVITMVAVGGLWLGLMVVAGRVPAGYFGLGVGFFVGFVLILLSVFLSGLGALWAILLAALYNVWGQRGGGLRWQAHRLVVPLEALDGERT